MIILQTLRGEDRFPRSTRNDTRIAVTRAIVSDPGGGFTRRNSATKEIIKLGLVFPFSSDKHRYPEFIAEDYAAAFKIAVDRVNNDSALLPNHEIQFVYNDTKFQETPSIEAIYQQLNRHNVSAFVGFGWSCYSAALIATALNVPIISYVRIIITSCSHLA